MKIAFDHQIFTFQSFGGISRYFVSLAGSLDNCGHSSRIFGGLHQNHYLDVEGGFPPVSIKMPFGAGRAVRLRWKLNDFLNKIFIPAWKPDVIHQTFQKPLAFRPDVPVVLTVYDMIYELVSQFDPCSEALSNEKRKAVDSADHIICISENTKRDLIRLFGTSAEKISVVHLAADSARNDVERYPNNGRPYLLVVGSRAGIKNFDRLLEALAMTDILDHADLIAFGGGAFTKEEEDKMASLEIDRSRVKQLTGDDLFLGRVYQGARLFVYPSLYEGFGLPPLEAMAAGCPVASSNTSSMPEVLGDAAAFFDPEKTEEIAGVLRDVFSDQEKRDSLVKAGRERAGLFSWKRTAEMTAAVYSKVIAERS